MTTIKGGRGNWNWRRHHTMMQDESSSITYQNWTQLTSYYSSTYLYQSEFRSNSHHIQLTSKILNSFLRLHHYLATHSANRYLTRPITALDPSIMPCVSARSNWTECLMHMNWFWFNCPWRIDSKNLLSTTEEVMKSDVWWQQIKNAYGSVARRSWEIPLHRV